MPSVERRSGYTEPRTGEYVRTDWEVRNWFHSSRGPDGKLTLTAHPYQAFRATIRNRRVESGYEYWAPHMGLLPTDVSSEFVSRLHRCEASSYAKFRGKLYQGAGALGVTLAGYKQARDMIVSRYNHLNERADVALAMAAREVWTPRKAANLHLEVIFGWTPMLVDIHAAASTIIQLAPTRGYIRATSSDVWHDKPHSLWQDIELRVRVTRAAGYTVSNPNTWLAERAGLLNPVAVAWDLVPWSFVVNMFVNTGQLVNSITDFAGLTFDNDTVTRTLAYHGQWNAHNRAHQFMTGLDMRRSLGVDQRPPVVFRLPDVSWGTAAMAASLFTQKIGAISRLVSKTLSPKKIGGQNAPSTKPDRKRRRRKPKNL